MSILTLQICFTSGTRAIFVRYYHCRASDACSMLNRSPLKGLDGARGRNRTVTPLSGPGILSPVRLPVSPPGQKVNNCGASAFSHKLRVSSDEGANPEVFGNLALSYKVLGDEVLRPEDYT